MDNMSHEAISKVMIVLTYEDMIRVRFTMENKAKSVIELGAKVKEITTKYLVITAMYEGGLKTIAIGVERIVALEKIIIPEVTTTAAEPPRISFCEQPKISNHFVDTIQRNVKTTKMSYGDCGKWDALPMDVRKFLTECAEYMLSLECVAQEGIELKQSIKKAQHERKTKVLYEKRDDVFEANFRRNGNNVRECGYIVPRNNLIDAQGNLVPEHEIHDVTIQDALKSRTMYVPVSREIREADSPEYAEQVLRNVIAIVKGKYRTAQSRQYKGDRPSGRMYGLGEAIDILEDTLAKVKKGDYDV